jgi:rubrerythrin
MKKTKKSLDKLLICIYNFIELPEEVNSIKTSYNVNEEQKKCNDCGNMVNKKEKQCPNCGNRDFSQI